MRVEGNRTWVWGRGERKENKGTRRVKWSDGWESRIIERV